MGSLESIAWLLMDLSLNNLKIAKKMNDINLIMDF